MNDLGLDRDAAAMLMVESDMPGAAAADELERAEAACRRPARRDVVRAADAQEADWLRQARRPRHYALERLGDVRMEDVGVPRSRVPEHAPRDRADRRAGTTSGSGRSAMPATATSTRTWSSTAATRDGRGQDRGRPGRALPGGPRPRRDGHRRARDRARRGASGCEVQRGADAVRGDARDQGRARPAGHPQPGPRHLAPLDGNRAAGRVSAPANIPSVRCAPQAHTADIRAWHAGGCAPQAHTADTRAWPAAESDGNRSGSMRRHARMFGIRALCGASAAADRNASPRTAIHSDRRPLTHTGQNGRRRVRDTGGPLSQRIARS